MEQLNILYPQLLNNLKMARDNHSYFCTNFLKIITKEGKIVPFILNNVQLDFLQHPLQTYGALESFEHLSF